MTKKILKITTLFLLTLTLVNCSDDNDSSTKNLDLNISGLENLGSDYVYEGWIIVGGNAITTGRFSVNDQGMLSQTSFGLDSEMLENASTFVLTIEPKNGDVPEPSKVHILAGDFNGKTGNLTVSHGAALGSDFESISGKYILATPTNDVSTDENSGIWFLDISSGAPAAGLSLPTLPAGWKYEGWIVQSGIAVTTGKFLTNNMADEFNGFSGTMSGPAFPGEDFLNNAPSGLTFPTDLSGGKAVISIEPDPDNSPNPFTLKPLVADIPQPATDHVTYMMGKNLSFPSGTVSR